MFESLDDQMKKDEARATSSRDRVMKWALAAIVTVLVFGGLYLGVSMLEGT